jgi:predicted ATP-dependent endonuclease of OLD family
LLHTDAFIPQVNALNEHLVRLGFGTLNLKGQQEAILDNVNVSLQGSGLRCVLPIIAALTSNTVTTLIIDEPELSLEARTQKELKRLLMETAKLVIIATKSHIFLNRQEPNANYVCKIEDNALMLKNLEDRTELLDLTYSLLGNSLEDLFFPNNFLIVKGSSDQIICEKCAELLKVPKDQVKVLSASGSDYIKATLKSIEDTLRPLIINTSPYAGRVVVLLDDATSKQQKTRASDIKKVIPERCFVLDRDSIEQYLPQYLYEKCRRNKKDDLLEITSAKEEKKFKPETGSLRLKKIKREIALSIAEILEKRDLDNIGIIRDAVAKAADFL